jgi:hypothetical protein
MLTWARTWLMVLNNIDKEVGGLLTTPLLSSLDIVSHTLSDEAFCRATTWLTDCLNRHAECKTGSMFKPGRLVNVGLFDGSREPFLFEPIEACPYIALS